MIVAADLQGFPAKRFPGMVLTLGAFDGVHVGHQRVLACVRRAARKRRGTGCVFTFQEDPDRVLRPAEKVSILTSFAHKLSLVQRAGIALCLAPHFDLAFSLLSPEAFVKKILVDALHVEKVVLGHDSRFGHRREGDMRLMASLAKKFGFDFAVVPPVRRSDCTVSSTLIRRLIGEGDLSQAAKLLGRTYSVMATVVKGAGRGKQIGFPTANLEVEGEILPPQGVYAVRVRNMLIDKRTLRKGALDWRFHFESAFLPAVLNLGTRPTFCGEPNAKPVAEVHIINYRGNLYGKTVEVEFVKKLRDEKRFAEPASLRSQISKDIKAATRWFSNIGS